MTEPHDPLGPLTTARDALLVDGSDSAFRKLVHDLFGFLYHHETIRAGHGAYVGLAGPAYSTLISILHLQREGEVNIVSISNHLHVTGAFVTRIVNQLSEKGYVSKTQAPGDKRRVSLEVTEAGRALLAELAPVQRQVNDVEFGRLTREDFATLCRITAQLVEDAQEAVALQKYLLKTAGQTT
ncbi:MAG: MarR family transcriptional regulator [Pseudomonadota bacterium]|nr:MarR family transcriptional regulator [Pseudomonadota bacterium]